MMPFSALLRRLRPPYRLRSVYERLLGTEVEVQVVAASRAQAEAAEQRALAEVERLTGILNRFDPQSEFSRWLGRRGESVSLSPDLYSVLEQAEHWQRVSGGAFHPAADALGAIWKEAAQKGQLPDPAALARQVSRLRRPLWTLHGGGRATAHADFPLGLNAFAKGYVVDRMTAALQASEGVEAGLINAGGDLCTFGAAGLPVQIADPFTKRDDAPPLTQVWIKDGALATSGSSHRGYQVGEQWFSHLLDPRTGQPVQAVPGVSVAAPTCAVADALATILSVLDPAEGRALIEATPGAAALMVGQHGEQWASAGWDALVVR